MRRRIFIFLGALMLLMVVAVFFFNWSSDATVTVTFAGYTNHVFTIAGTTNQVEDLKVFLDVRNEGKSEVALKYWLFRQGPSTLEFKRLPSIHYEVDSTVYLAPGNMSRLKLDVPQTTRSWSAWMAYETPNSSQYKISTFLSRFSGNSIFSKLPQS